MGTTRTSLCAGDRESRFGTNNDLGIRNESISGRRINKRMGFGTNQNVGNRDDSMVGNRGESVSS